MSDLLAMPKRDDASESARANAAHDTNPRDPGDDARGGAARGDTPPVPTGVPVAVVRPATRQGRRLSLDTLPVPVESAPSIASLRFEATSKNGVHHTVDLTGLPGSALTQALARALRSWLTRLRVDVDKGAWAVRQLHRLADALAGC